MAFTILEASSISRAFQVVVDFIADWATTDPPYCWFRGINNRRRSLAPGACWRTAYDEYQALVTFAQEGVAFRDIGSLDDWDTYYLAQHHGVPTRLLDWTESFSAALFFAFDGWNGRTTPCIWILQPCSFNQVFIDWSGVIAPENIPETSIWLPRRINEETHLLRQDKDGYVYDNRWPLAIYPKKTNRRIHAQQGVFTLHGRQTQPLDVLIRDKGGPVEPHLARLDLAGFATKSVFRELSLLGITRSSIYPDIDNFVRQLKDSLGW